MDGPTTSASTRRTVDEVLRIVLAVACFGAAAMHLMFARTHFDNGAAHGIYFFALAGVQIAAGVALLVKPARAFLAVAFGVNLLAVVVWGLAEIVDVDTIAEPVSAADVIALVLQTLVVVGVVVLVDAPARTWNVGDAAARVWIGSAIGAVVLLLALSVTPSLPEETVTVTAVAATPDEHAAHDMSGHAHDGTDVHEHDVDGTERDGHSHGPDGQTVGASAHRHDDGITGTTHGHGNSTNTTAGHSGDGHNHTTGSTAGTTGHNHGNSTSPTTAGHNHNQPTSDEQWEKTRRTALLGGLDVATQNARWNAINEYLRAQLMTRSALLRGMSAQLAKQRVDTYLAWLTEHALDSEHADATGNHTHGPAVWQQLSAVDSLVLQEQLREAARVHRQYPTAADAMAAGYFQVTPWAPGIGAHYLNASYTGSFDPLHPSMLLYNGNSPNSVIVGVSYAVLGSAAPAGFAGPNDTWHTHPALCLVGGTFVVGADNTPSTLCSSVGGAKGNGFGGTPFWMMHLWQVPGWESAWGLFSGESPAVNLATTDIR